MKIFIFFILALSAMLLVNPYGFMLASNPPVYLITENSMPSTTVRIKILSLMAREERRLPSGASSDPNRDIGFASVFIRLENTREENTKLIIQKIEIRQVSNAIIPMVNQSPQEIYLRPLENSENAFHLTNKTGYSGQDRVKAVITYQVGNRVEIIESEPVEVSRL